MTACKDGEAPPWRSPPPAKLHLGSFLNPPPSLKNHFLAHHEMNRNASVRRWSGPNPGRGSGLGGGLLHGNTWTQVQPPRSAGLEAGALSCSFRAVLSEAGNVVGTCPPMGMSSARASTPPSAATAARVPVSPIAVVGKPQAECPARDRRACGQLPRYRVVPRPGESYRRGGAWHRSARGSPQRSPL